MSDNRIVHEIEHGERTVAGIDVRVTEQVWGNGGRSFDVHRVDDGTDLTEGGSFDTLPTNAQIAELFRSLGALWVCHCGTPYDANDADMIADHVRGCDFVDGAGQPINQAEALGAALDALTSPGEVVDALAARQYLDKIAAPAPAGDKVELNWSIEVTENWSTTIDVGDLVDAINETLNPDHDEDATPVTADGVRAALRTGTFVRLYGRVLARDNLGAGDMGGILPDWEDIDLPNTSVSSNVTERYLDTAKLAEEGGS